MPERFHSRDAAILAALAVLAGACVAQATFGHFSNDLSGNAIGVDDAYISYRYARNLYEHGELVFNLGDRVEGYSNLLYTLLMVPGFAVVGANRIYGWSVASNIGATIAAVALLVRFVWTRSGASAARMTAWTVALCPVLWLWTGAGLETPFVLLIQIATWIAVEEDQSAAWLAGLATAAVLIRADGFLIPTLSATFLWLTGRRRTAIATAAATVASLGAATVWRLAYYGQPLPNTYYAKVSGSIAERVPAAFHQLVVIAPDTGLVAAGVLCLAAPAIAWSRRRYSPESQRQLSFYPTLFTITNVGYWLYIGGDVFDDRFLVALFLMGAGSTAMILGAHEHRDTRVVLAGVLIAGQLSALSHHQPRFRLDRHRYDHRQLLGHFLGERYPGAVLAIDAAGKIPYWSRLPTIDMLGLNEAVIAHGPQARTFIVGLSKFDADYVLRARPALIAAWAGQSALSLDQGLTREKYMANGYRIRYLVNSRREAVSENIIDVRGLPDSEVQDRIDRGFAYIVLAREDAPR